MATYYVATGGSDATGGTHGQIGNPWATVQYAWDHMSAGDTCYVRSGTYDEGLGPGSVTGTGWGAGQLIRIAAYPSETVWLAASSSATTYAGLGFCTIVDANVSYTEFDGINTDGTNSGGANIIISTNNSNDPHHFRIKNSEHIAGAIGGSAAVLFGGHTVIGATGSNELVNCVVHGGGLPGVCGFACASYGVYLAGPNCLVDGCEIYDTSGAGIQVFNNVGGIPDGDPPDDCIIRNTYIHDITRLGDANQGWGIVNWGANNTQIYNVKIWNLTVGGTTGNGIQITNSNNCKVWHCVVVDVPRYCFIVTSGTGNVLQNNIAYGYGVGAFSDGGTSTTQDHNLFAGQNPQFVNYAGGDFTITSVSPAYHAGVYIPSVSADFARVPYNNPPSMGAYEVGTIVDVVTLTAGRNSGDDYSGLHDARIRSDAPTTNFGATGILSVENYSPTTIGYTLLRFPSLPTGRRLVSAAIRLYVSSINLTSTIGAFRCLKPWTELGVDYETIDGVTPWTGLGGTDSADIEATASASVDVSASGVWVTLSSPTLTTYFQDVLDGTIDNDGHKLVRTDGSNDTAFCVFTSSEGADGFRAYLEMVIEAGDGALLLVVQQHS